MTQSAVARLAKIIKVIRFCVRVCGTDVSDPNFHWNWLSYCTLACILSFFACTAYTIYEGFGRMGWTVVMPALAVAGSAAQGLSKMLNCSAHAATMRLMQATYEVMYQEYEGRTSDYTKCLHQRINTFWYLMMAFMWVYISMVSVLTGVPLFEYVVFNKKSMVLQFVIPGVDPETDSGYLILNALHVLCLMLGSFGNFGGDMYVFLFVVNVPLLRDILKLKLIEFNEVVLQPDKYEEMRAMLWDLLAWHQKYATILEGTKQIYSAIIFVQLTSGCVGIMCTIFCILMKVWPCAPAYLFYCLVVLYSFCYLGTMVENTNEQFTEEIYSNCLWYEMPVKEQKLVVLMLAKSQKELSLTAVGMLPLSMATGLQLTKGIYSFSMMLLTYMDNEKYEPLA